MDLVVMNNHRMIIKESEMNENVKDLISAIASGDALETEQAFNAAMAEKISAKMDDMRIQVASTMFSASTDITDEIDTTDSVDATVEVGTEETGTEE